MRVKLTIIDPLDPLGGKAGGAETFLKGLVRFAPEDFDIRFLGLTKDPSARPVKVWSRVCLDRKTFDLFPVMAIGDENVKPVFPLSLRFSLHLLVSRLRIPPSVLLFNRLEPAGLKKTSPLPKVAFVHNDVPSQILSRGGEVLWSRWPGLYLWFEKRVVPSLDILYTSSTSSLAHFQNSYPGKAGVERFRLFRSWVDTGIFYPADEGKSVIRQRLFPGLEEFQGDKKWILFVGRLQEQKAPLRLIESFAALRRRNKTACLLIIGTGNLLEALEKKVMELSLGPWVRLAGRIDHRALPDYYRASDALVLTSLYEGMPFCALEALSCGLPVVTTNAGEVASVVKNGYSGEIIRDYSPGAVAAALEKVVANPSIYARGNCRDSISAFTPDNVLRSIYQGVRDLFYERIDHGSDGDEGLPAR